MNKLSVRHFYPRLYKLSKRDTSNCDRIIEDMKEDVKRDPDVKKKFKEYNIPLDAIDNVSVEFADLDVSAKTKDKKIYLNRKMLEPDSEIDDPTHYLAHELIHYLQQKCNETDGHLATDDYLEKPTEQEAFNVQYDYKKRNEGEGDADEYIDEVLDHHNKSGPEREKLEKDIKEFDK